MGSTRYSRMPGRRISAAALDTFYSKHIFISLVIIPAAVCLILAGCSEDTAVAPINGDDTDDPVCPINTPWVEIVAPDVGGDPFYPPRIDFSWEQDQEYKIAFTRYLITGLEPGETGTEMLNKHPEQFEDLWSDWKEWDTVGDSAVIGGDNPLENGIYFFAVQARDSCGKATDHYALSSNARQFTVNTFPPILALYEPFLGAGTFIGTWSRPPAAFVLPGVEFAFRWEAESSYSWFGPVQFRYGWDIQNLEEDGEWTFPWSSQIKTSFPKRFASGIHVFHVQARDDAGTVTSARVELEVIPFTKEHDLLWIDDFRLSDVVYPGRYMPTEPEHDEFWTDICSIAPGFNPARDIYEADIYGRGNPLPLEMLAGYRNVVWTTDGTADNAWGRTIEFEPAAATSFPFPRPNNLRMYLAAGGAALTCGMGNLGGSALSATFRNNPQFPASVTDDLADYEYDEEYAKSSMARDDYYVTVIDKVHAYYRDDLPDGVVRHPDRDAMTFATFYTGMMGDFPQTLTLWEEITQPGMYFDPAERGFTYVEVYDPEYYMDYILKQSHRCFRPLYLMRSRSTLSPLDHTAVALITAWDECESLHLPRHESYHFGLPLWFIDHDQVEQLADAVFQRWLIR